MTQIVVNHITRMTEPRICVAGIEVNSKQHLRPVTDAANPLTTELLVESGGPFEIGAEVDLGETEARPNPPETEDHDFDPEATEGLGRLEPAKYWELLEGVSVDSLAEAFGPELERRKKSYAIVKGHGQSSLACVRPPGEVGIRVNTFGKLRVTYREGDGAPASIAVTDLRLFEADQKEPRRKLVRRLAERIESGVIVLLMFGLARAFTAGGDDTERHWLQVNGICLEDDPLVL